MITATVVSRQCKNGHICKHGHISSSLRDFIVLVLNIEVFQIKFFLKIKSLKKKKKKKKIDENCRLQTHGAHARTASQVTTQKHNVTTQKNNVTDPHKNVTAQKT